MSDFLFVLNGKWKLPILISLRFENKRFSEISKSIPGITERMLSKELRFLELNNLIKRTIYGNYPVRIEYEITEHGKTLDLVLLELKKWAQKHGEILFDSDC
ncbi:winged helix-turn-helix transcriptional regulator [Sphingobacterium sp. Ag1]|uniref:winged helix-turn-helix transcriptional regulator n=1 Tax=Sphingobacterium sp. Ag1 TaxID=1643451 RepID=UPI000A4207BE|nr:winged helix-turn-helix transcriptional regulator [Sphingobacterium sp. Ag1]